MLNVSIIAGYLGAGKTTLVNHLLRHANGQKLAILVNEFGALPIDEDLIEAKDDALISIAGGCVCCSYGNDLIDAMIDMSKLNPPPDHVLIEASGVALPGAIAGAVSVMDAFQLDGIVAITDAETIRTQARDDYIGDTIERQLAEADLVVLNKADLVTPAQLTELESWLTTAAPNASVIPAEHGQVANAIILQNYAPDIDAMAPAPHSAPFDTEVLMFPKPVNADALAKALADPALNLVRAKGFVPTSTGLRAIQLVGRRYTVTDAPDAAKPGLVAIALKSKLDRAKLEAAVASSA